MNLSDIFTNDSQKPVPKPNAVRRLSGDDGPWSPEHVRGIICNPCYAGVGPYPGLVPEAAWVHAAARTIHEDGPGQLLGSMGRGQRMVDSISAFFSHVLTGGAVTCRKRSP